jgi:hypothetical protein
MPYMKAVSLYPYFCLWLNCWLDFHKIQFRNSVQYVVQRTWVSGESYCARWISVLNFYISWSVWLKFLTEELSVVPSARVSFVKISALSGILTWRCNCNLCLYFLHLMPNLSNILLKRSECNAFGHLWVS